MKEMLRHITQNSFRLNRSSTSQPQRPILLTLFSRPLRPDSSALGTFHPVSLSSKVPLDTIISEVNNTIPSVQSGAIAFDNSSLAFSHKSTKELLRALFVLHACAIDSLVSRSYNLMRFGERILGHRLFNIVLFPFYDQFVGGNNEKTLQKVIQNLSSVGISLMVLPVFETEIGDQLTEGNNMAQSSFNKTAELISISSKNWKSARNSRLICQTKISSYINANYLFRIASEYSALSEDKRISCIQELAAEMERSGQTDNPRGDRARRLTYLNVDDQCLRELHAALPRLYKLGKLCYEKDVVLAVDAEYSYINPAINYITLAMMSLFNKKQPVIWNTYQGYLKTARQSLTHDFQMAKHLGSTFGIKLVRGAYLETERAYAKLHGTPDPVHDSYENTNTSYNSLLEFYSLKIADSLGHCQLMVATHNEASVIQATHLMNQLGIAPSDSQLVFAQIYGMADNISVPLAKHGYTVYKSVPYGNVSETLPYLARRANENRAVFKGARQERLLLLKELKKRMHLH